MDYLQELKNNKEIFINYLREKYHVIYNSNIFFREIQYGVLTYFEKKGIKLNYPKTEELAYHFAEILEETGELVRMDNRTWKVNFKSENVVSESSADSTE